MPSNYFELLPDAIKVALLVSGALEQLGIPYLVGGSLAGIIYGEPRLTNDVDIVADIKAAQIPALVATLEAEFYIDDRALLRAVRERKSCNLIYLEKMFKVDIYIYRDDDWAREQMHRRRTQFFLPNDQLNGIQVADAETTLLQKLSWYKQGGEASVQQWRDVLGILKVQAEALDYDYLRHWADELAVGDLLLRAFTDAGIESGL